MTHVLTRLWTSVQQIDWRELWIQSRAVFWWMGLRVVTVVVMGISVGWLLHYAQVELSGFSAYLVQLFASVWLTMMSVSVVIGMGLRARFWLTLLVGQLMWTLGMLALCVWALVEMSIGRLP